MSSESQDILGEEKESSITEGTISTRMDLLGVTTTESGGST